MLFTVKISGMKQKDDTSRYVWYCKFFYRSLPSLFREGWDMSGALTVYFTAVFVSIRYKGLISVLISHSELATMSWWNTFLFDSFEVIKKVGFTVIPTHLILMWQLLISAISGDFNKPRRSHVSQNNLIPPAAGKTQLKRYFQLI